MALNKDGFTEEQLAEIEAEIDRERTRAAETARKNAQKVADEALQLKIDEAVNEERARLEMNEQQKLEAERQKVEESRVALARERKGLAAEKKLVGAGIPEDSIETLLPLFVNLDDATFGGAVDSFITMSQSLVKNQVDTLKQELLHNATPPATPPGAPVDQNTAALEAAKAGNTAEAIDMLIGVGAPPAQ